MKIRFIFLAGAIALATLPLASATSRDITLDQPSIAGNVELQAGNYRVTLKGSEAVFTRVYPGPYMWAMQTTYGKSLRVAVNFEMTGKKFPYTTVTTDRIGDGNEAQIKSIELGGTHTELEFNGDWTPPVESWGAMPGHASGVRPPIGAAKFTMILKRASSTAATLLNISMPPLLAV